MASLDSFRLVVFRAVAEQLSFRKAAEELYLTQPAVSLQIKALEEDTRQYRCRELKPVQPIRGVVAVVVVPVDERAWQLFLFAWMVCPPQQKHAIEFDCESGFLHLDDAAGVRRDNPVIYAASAELPKANLIILGSASLLKSSQAMRISSRCVPALKAISLSFSRLSSA
jgi:hypothetical protein